MIGRRIRILQNELNRMVAENEDYSRIYELSLRLDKLIVRYHRGDKKT